MGSGTRAGFLKPMLVAVVLLFCGCAAMAADDDCICWENENTSEQNPAEIEHGDRVYFWDCSDDPNNDIGGWEWIVWSNSGCQEGTGDPVDSDCGRRVNNSYRTDSEHSSALFWGEGSHTITLKIYNRNGGLLDQCSEDIYVNASPPEASFEWSPSDPEVGETVTFTDTSSTSNRPWCLRFFVIDGVEQPCGSEVTHVFDQPGRYEVKIIVGDRSGLRDSFTDFVSVGDSPCASNQPPGQPTNQLGQPPDSQFEDRGTGFWLHSSLAWRAVDPERDDLIYDVYFGDTHPPELLEEGIDYYGLHPCPPLLDYDTTYYWQVVAKDPCHPEGTAGPIWEFTTPGASPCLFDDEDPTVEIDVEDIDCDCTERDCGIAQFEWHGTDDCTPPNQLEYRFMLEGRDTSWSDWGRRRKVSYEGLVDGYYNFRIEAKDSKGNRSFEESCDFDVECLDLTDDETEPTITLNPDCGAVACEDDGGRITIAWTIEDEVSEHNEIWRKYWLEGLRGETWSQPSRSVVSKTYSGLPDGCYTFEIEAEDAAGNPAEEMCEFCVECEGEGPDVVDTIPPTIGIEVGEAQCAEEGGSISVSWTVSDEISSPDKIRREYWLEDEDGDVIYQSRVSRNVTGKTFPQLYDSEYTLVIIAVDAVGNDSEAETHFVISCGVDKAEAALKSPENLTAVRDDDGSITTEWTGVSPGVEGGHTEIERKVLGDDVASFQHVGTVIGEELWTDPSPAHNVGIGYVYRVRNVIGWSKTTQQVSAYSNEAVVQAKSAVACTLQLFAPPSVRVGETFVVRALPRLRSEQAYWILWEERPFGSLELLQREENEILGYYASKGTFGITGIARTMDGLDLCSSSAEIVAQGDPGYLAQDSEAFLRVVTSQPHREDPTEILTFDRWVELTDLFRETIAANFRLMDEEQGGILGRAAMLISGAIQSVTEAVEGTIEGVVDFLTGVEDTVLEFTGAVVEQAKEALMDSIFVDISGLIGSEGIPDENKEVICAILDDAIEPLLHDLTTEAEHEIDEAFDRFKKHVDEYVREVLGKAKTEIAGYSPYRSTELALNTLIANIPQYITAFKGALLYSHAGLIGSFKAVGVSAFRDLGHVGFKGLKAKLLPVFAVMVVHDVTGAGDCSQEMNHARWLFEIVQQEMEELRIRTSATLYYYQHILDVVDIHRRHLEAKEAMIRAYQSIPDWVQDLVGSNAVRDKLAYWEWVADLERENIDNWLREYGARVFLAAFGRQQLFEQISMPPEWQAQHFLAACELLLD